MKVLLAPHGTRGDVQPLLALARGLRERGHEPSFLVPDDCVRWIRDSGFPCEPNGIDVAGTFGSRGAAVASGRWPWRQFVDVVVPALFESFGARRWARRAVRTPHRARAAGARRRAFSRQPIRARRTG